MASILIADDAPGTAEMFAQILELAGHTVTPVTSGEEAAQVGASQDFDLVVLDLAMPEVNGFMAAERIHRAKPNAKIAFLTAYNEPLSVGRAEAVGSVAIWGKPIDAAQLRANVVEVLNERP